MKIFNVKTVEISADDLRLIILKKFLDQFDNDNDHPIEAKFIIDSSQKTPVLKGVTIAGYRAMEI